MTNTLGWIFISASSLKQSAGRYVTALGHIILIPSQPVFALTPCNADVFGKSNKYRFYSLWFDSIGALTHDIPHSQRAQ
jgi:hypothetical protein